MIVTTSQLYKVAYNSVGQLDAVRASIKG